MRDDLRRRLRELGVVQGVRELATRPPRPQTAIEDLMPGRFHTTSHGQCFVVELSYPVEHRHGDHTLARFLDLSPHVLTQIGRDPALSLVDPGKACFIDTETTGLSGGAGTMAFVVGLGFFEGGEFHVHQYFLRDPGDEPAMVETLARQLFDFEYLVSFNGVAFDVPILENRFILARIPPPTTHLPHLDLLHPSRRLWRYALPSCALGSLESEALGVQREQADVPGGLIPYLYRDYLRTGDAREMKRVLYHNEIDVLSLVTLAVRLHQAVVDPWNDEALSGAALYGLARWYASDERAEEAERAYRAALVSALQADVRARTLRDLGRHLKRAERYTEAFGYWQQLALESSDDVDAHVELAKYFEWRVDNLMLAAGWTRAALAQVEAWPPGLRRDAIGEELVHRLTRLERKMAAEVHPKEKGA